MVAGVRTGTSPDEHALAETCRHIWKQARMVDWTAASETEERQRVEVFGRGVHAQIELQADVRRLQWPVRKSQATAVELVHFPPCGGETIIGQHALLLQAPREESELRQALLRLEERALSPVPPARRVPPKWQGCVLGATGRRATRLGLERLRRREGRVRNEQARPHLPDHAGECLATLFRQPRARCRSNTMEQALPNGLHHYKGEELALKFHHAQMVERRDVRATPCGPRLHQSQIGDLLRLGELARPAEVPDGLVAGPRDCLWRRPLRHRLHDALAYHVFRNHAHQTLEPCAHSDHGKVVGADSADIR
mmetsp:Transcript_22156/g.66264  ORF Transcript_22156/g.66264 Transcript_22156/m.66264 type:complete len:310 (-) Transcript_22156:153-1082(-)